MNELLNNIDKIHTTKLGIQRITNNIQIENKNVVEYCKNIIKNKECTITKKGKNWYCNLDNIIITINSYSYTIITAHIKENKYDRN